MLISIISIVSIFIWVAVILELNKDSKKHNNQKIIILTSVGTLLTLVLTISLFQKVLF